MNIKSLMLLAATGAIMLTGCSKKLNQAFRLTISRLIPIRSK